MREESVTETTEMLAYGLFSFGIILRDVKGRKQEVKVIRRGKDGEICDGA